MSEKQEPYLVEAGTRGWGRPYQLDTSGFNGAVESRPMATTPEDALKLAVARAGSQVKLAKICGCTQSAISQMLNKPHPRLSHQYVLAVSAALDIPRSALRPDLYPPGDYGRSLRSVA
jgi:DNA-binding transcriptional regulator YdaS (Cro superfamily)